MNTILIRLCHYVVLLIIAIIMLMPFIWMVSTSLKPDVEIFSLPLRLLPKTPRLSNFTDVISAANFPRYLANSFIVATGKTILELFFASLAGYALARLRFPGRQYIFLLILASFMIPYEVLVIPIFILVKRMPLAGGNNIFGQGGTGGIDTYWGLIMPGALSPIGVFLCRQFFKALPFSLEDAARIDGSSEFGIYWRIMLPLSKPLLAVLGILTFIRGWNEFMWPLLITRSTKMKTIQLGLATFLTRDTINWRLLMTACLISVIPMILIYLLGLKYFTKGIAFTGQK